LAELRFINFLFHNNRGDIYYYIYFIFIILNIIEELCIEVCVCECVNLLILVYAKPIVQGKGLKVKCYKL